MPHGRPRRSDRLLALAGLLGLVLSAVARGQQPPQSSPQQQNKPLWEFGLGVGGALFDDYRGAATSHTYPLPVPYFVYRGNLLRSDSNGLRGLFFNRPYVEFNISVNAMPPVFNSPTRTAMPPLSSSLEIGPALQWHLWRAADERLKLDLVTPVRDAIALSWPVRSIGWRFTPALNLDYRPPGWPLTGISAW